MNVRHIHIINPNRGEVALKLSKADKRLHVVAIQGNPLLSHELRLRTRSTPIIEVLDLLPAERCGEKDLCVYNSLACSSILEPVDQSEKKKVIKKQARRLDMAIDQGTLKVPLFVYCDGKGKDIEYLKSYGRFLNRIPEITILASKVERRVGQNSVDEIKQFMKEEGFTLTCESPADNKQREVYLKFKRDRWSTLNLSRVF